MMWLILLTLHWYSWSNFVVGTLCSNITNTSNIVSAQAGDRYSELLEGLKIKIQVSEQNNGASGCTTTQDG